MTGSNWEPAEKLGPKWMMEQWLTGMKFLQLETTKMRQMLEMRKPRPQELTMHPLEEQWYWRHREEQNLEQLGLIAFGWQCQRKEQLLMGYFAFLNFGCGSDFEMMKVPRLYLRVFVNLRLTLGKTKEIV